MNFLPHSRFLVRISLLMSLLVTSLASGADIRFVPSKWAHDIEATGSATLTEDDHKMPTEWAHVKITGNIVEGDVQKLQQALNKLEAARDIKSATPIVIIDTPGGDVSVALQMGIILRDSLAYTIVAPNGNCSSSGVLLLAAGVERSAYSSGRIGLHRPRFEYEPFANLSSEQARAEYDALAKECADYMKKMGISDQVFSDMLKVPSHEIRFVDRAYAKKHGLIGTDPAWEEWSRAKGIIKKREIEKFWISNLLLYQKITINERIFQAVMNNIPEANSEKNKTLNRHAENLTRKYLEIALKSTELCRLKRINNGEDIETANRHYEKETRALRDYDLAATRWLKRINSGEDDETARKLLEREQGEINSRFPQDLIEECNKEIEEEKMKERQGETNARATQDIIESTRKGDKEAIQSPEQESAYRAYKEWLREQQEVGWTNAIQQHP